MGRGGMLDACGGEIGRCEYDFDRSVRGGVP